STRDAVLYSVNLATGAATALGTVVPEAPNFLSVIGFALAPTAPPRPQELRVTGAGAGGGPHVRVFDALGERLSFFAYDAAFRGGVRVASGDVNRDGVPDIITAPGPGGGPHVRVFDGRTGAPIAGFLAYEAAFRGGLFVA